MGVWFSCRWSSLHTMFVTYNVCPQFYEPASFHQAEPWNIHFLICIRISTESTNEAKWLLFVEHPYWHQKTYIYWSTGIDWRHLWGPTEMCALNVSNTGITTQNRGDRGIVETRGKCIWASVKLGDTLGMPIWLETINGIWCCFGGYTDKWYICSKPI